jgi:hypothetical protein
MILSDDPRDIAITSPNGEDNQDLTCQFGLDLACRNDLLHEEFVSVSNNTVESA